MASSVASHHSTYVWFFMHAAERSPRDPRLPAQRIRPRPLASGARLVTHRVIVLRDILLASTALTGLLGIIMLVALLEQPILSRIVVSGNLRRVVARAVRTPGFGGFDGVCGLVEFLVAGVVLVVAHGWLVCDGMPLCVATAMPATQGRSPLVSAVEEKSTDRADIARHAVRQ